MQRSGASRAIPGATYGRLTPSIMYDGLFRYYGQVLRCAIARDRSMHSQSRIVLSFHLYCFYFFLPHSTVNEFRNVLTRTLLLLWYSVDAFYFQLAVINVTSVRRISSSDERQRVSIKHLYTRVNIIETAPFLRARGRRMSGAECDSEKPAEGCSHF